ncbi:hypothetical protein HELRODRAFT_190823 [Helobdella robusta]|uniref:Uncharacterized protein n=1 Tax=Helobdella robusta TaxID=6412 RepID=T1FSB7_HELRO|nr:hypothetical protein HELRODRAFT_190823 [Helobdella robusta]ESO07945.1 hypothetical protein HELRODRAFT_190823 [Helobdella robusta]
MENNSNNSNCSHSKNRRRLSSNNSNRNNNNDATSIADVHLEKIISENGKLMKENVELHQKFIQMKEATDAKIRELKSLLKKLEQENTSFRYLNSQFEHKIKLMEVESKQKNEKIMELQDKNLQAIIQTSGNKKKSSTTSLQQQRMEIDNHVPPARRPLNPTTTNSNKPNFNFDPYTADLLKIADENINRLRIEVSTLTSENIAFQNCIDNLQRKQYKIIIKVETRNDEIARLTKLLEAGNLEHLLIAMEAKNRNHENTITHLNEQIGSLKRENLNLKNIYHNNNNDNNNNNNEVNINDNSNDTTNKKSVDDNCPSDHQAIQSKDHKRVKEKELVMEIDRLRHQRIHLQGNASQNNSNKNNKMNKNNHNNNNNNNGLALCSNKSCRNGYKEVDAIVKNLEREKEYWMNEVDTLHKVLSVVSRNNSLTITNEKLRNANKQQQNTQQKITTTTTSTARNNKIITSTTNDCCDDDNDDGGGGAGDDVERDLEMVRKERDEMKMMIEKYEKHINEIQANVDLLSQERDHVNMLYSQAKSELSERRRFDIERLKAASLSSAPSASSSLQMALMAKERDSAIERVNELMRERNQLHEKIAELNEMMNLEKEDHEDQLNRLKESLLQSEQSESSLREKCMKLEGMIEGRNANCDERMNKMRDEINQHKATASQMRMIADEAERLTREANSSLNLSQAELKMMRNRADDLEREVEEWREDSRRKQEEVSQLKKSLKSLDREKDELQSLIDEKAESYASRDREASSLKRKYDSLAGELDDVKKGRDGLMKENKRLQDDITAVTKNNQILNRDFQDALNARDLSSGQMQEYLNEVKRCQELLSSKEKEKNDAIQQYALLIVQSERLESINRSLETELASQKMRILNGDAELRRALERCNKLERELQGTTDMEQRYSVQLNQVSKRSSSLEEAAVRLENDKRVLRSDLEAARELCFKLECDKEQLLKKVALKSVANEEVEALLEDRQHEVEALKVQLNQAKQSIDNLENVLQLNRSREWQLQVTLQEKQSELQLLRDRVGQFEVKLSNQSRELLQHRSRSIEMEADVERLKRQIISEKFERERAVQELKRHNLPLPGESRLGPISPIR